MVNCKKCEYRSGEWCHLRNKQIVSTVCAKFKPSLWTRIVSNVKRIFEKGW